MTATMTRRMSATCAAALSLIVGAAACEAGTLTTFATVNGYKTGETPNRDLVRVGNKLFATTEYGASKNRGSIISVKDEDRSGPIGETSARSIELAVHWGR